MRNISEAGQKSIGIISNLLMKSTATTLPVVINALIDICETRSLGTLNLYACFFLDH